MNAITPESASVEMRRGWPIVLAALIGTACGMSGISIFTLGVMTKPLADTFGWSRAEIQGLLACFVVGALIGSPIVGLLMDRHGVRAVTIASTVGFAVSLVLLGLFTNSLWQFYAFGVLSGTVGAGTTSVTWSRAVMSWFRIKRGLALGVALTGSGFCAAFAPIYATWLVQEFGWRMAYVGLAVLPALIALPLTLLFLRPPPEATTAEVTADQEGKTLPQALRTYAFWGIGLGLLLAGFGTSGVIPNLIPLLTDRGLTAMGAAEIAGLMGFAVIAGRLLAGYLIDRIWAPAVAAVLLGVPAVASFILAGEQHSQMVTTVAAMVVGLAGGAEYDLLAFLTARYLGFKHFGAIYGTMYAVFITGTGIAPIVFGAFYDVQGDYVTALYFGAACFVGSAAMMLTLGRYPPVTSAR
jgi:MFS family permease